LADAMPRLREEMGKARNVLLESNSVMEFVEPDLYLVVLDPAKEDFKDSAREWLERADAVVMHTGVPLEVAKGKPTFRVKPPQYVSGELVEFVRERIVPSGDRAIEPSKT
jgi:NAD(P)H-dependent flavin oxidoreductase YrpB (nitropropane dioxygenase family)